MLTGGFKSVLVALALGGSISVIACGDAMAGKRMALLIGNASYKNVPSLKNPVNDARGVKEALEKIGFQAELVTDVNEKKFRRALKDFADRARDAEAVLFYYAGHGVEEQKVGYLLPTDVEIDDLRSIELSQVPSIDLVATAIGGLRGPKILIVDEPTRGIDVGAKIEVHNILFEMAKAGVAVLVVSSELPEVLALADRIVTMREGRVTGEIARAQASQETLMSMMALDAA